MKRLTVYEFIEKANETHEAAFDYSQIRYVYSSKKVPIICKKCNLYFEQTARTHLNGAGCPNCNRSRKETVKFIEDAIIVHGEKYSYDKSDYRGYKNKVIITCTKNKHGDFEQTPSAHLSGQGCPHCGGSMKKKPVEFIKAAKQKHNNKYTYEKVVYTNNKTPVLIYCPIHNLEFEQTPNLHLSGGVCPKCNKTRKKTRDEFIQLAISKHGNKYNYDKVAYVGNSIKVTITCRENGHGDFEQAPSNHLAGQGCPKCGGAQKSNSESFILKAKNIHGDKYDYKNVRYINSKKKVDIFCRRENHGFFSQIAQYHLSGNGCPKCGNNLLTDIEDFITKASQKHRNSYKYDDVKYINRKTKVEIICKFHGPFWQRPASHLSGQGCPKCKKSIGEVEVEKYLNSKGVKFEEQYTFADCIYKRKLPFDFAVFIDDKIGLIEYQGEQHFRVVSYGKKSTAFADIQKRDEVKRKYAASNKIPLLIISYNEFDDIETKIIRFIKNNFEAKTSN